jgi:hypothetical protein
MKIEATLKAACHGAVFASAFASIAFASASARADDVPAEFVDRKLTLPPLVIAADGALAVGHWDVPGVVLPAGTAGAVVPATSGTGFGFNAEGSIGIIEHLTVGARVIGLNFSDDSKISNAAGYGRMYDLQPFNSGGSTFSNPELWGRYEFVDMEKIEVGVDARITLPFDSGSSLGLMGGVPVSFHFPGSVRIDTGGYIGLAFSDPVVFYFHIPAQAWFQINPNLFLGPISGLTIYNASAGGQTDTATALNLGFGIGYTVIPALDIKALPIYWPSINNNFGQNGFSNFGFSAGIEYRIDALANR